MYLEESNLKMTTCPDEDISGDHLLAEARVSLVKIFPQMQKQFQVGFRLDLPSTIQHLEGGSCSLGPKILRRGGERVLYVHSPHICYIL